MKKWGGILGRFASMQLVAQVIAFATGLVIVRSLPKVEYAHYSIAVALVAAFTMVADSGISAALLSAGARFRGDPGRLSSLFAGAVRFRGIFGIVIAVPTIVVLCFLLWRNGATPAETALAALLVLINFVPVLSITIFQNYHRLELNFRVLQRVTIQISLVRFVLIGVCALFGFGSMLSLLAVGALSSIAGAIYLWHAMNGRVDFSASIERVDILLMKMNVRKTLPLTFLLVMSEQLTTVLISLFGTVTVLAEVSALARFSVAFVIVNAVVSDIGAPWIARTESSKPLLAKRIGLIVLSYVGLASVGVFLVWICSGPLLFLLGPSYAGLDRALVIMAAGAAALNTAYALNSLNQSRNWLNFSWVYAPLLAIWATASALILDLSDVNQAAAMVATLAIPALLTQLARTASGLRRPLAS